MTNSDLLDSLSVGTDAPRIAFRVLKGQLSSVPPDIHHYYRRHRADVIQDISTVNYRVIILKSAPQSIAVMNDLPVTGCPVMRIGFWDR